MSERFEELARELGARAAQRLDVEAMAQKVVQRLREQPAARRPVWIQQTWLRIAAAIVIVVGGAFALRHVWSTRDSGAHVAHFVADDLSDLSADELRAVLTSFEALVAGDSVAVPESGTDLRELDAQQLRAVLRSLEG
jgi:uncharacterized NAD(P)/FAD-binding protein YdhS